MIKFLIGFVTKRKSENEARSALATLSGVTGIACNLVLFIVKLAVGGLCGSVAITADAFNNLSDCASNAVTITGTRLSVKPDDKEHPFGHGRAEYVAATIVAVSVFVVSLELAKSSVEKILHPEEIKFSLWYVLILLATVLVKLWMALLNSKLYRITDNLTLKGISQDSLNDCIATTGAILSLVLSYVLGVRIIDGIIGLCVSAFVMMSGVSLLKSVISPLLGEPPSKEITDRIEQIICENDIVLGVHDLVIHSYGANKMLASADAEVDAKADIFAIHEVIDAAEKKILNELNIIICIHTDPVDSSDKTTENFKALTEEIIKNYNPNFSFHDLGVAENGGKTNLAFDLIIPFDESLNAEKIKADLKAEFLKKHSEIDLNINVEHPYV